MKGKGEGYSFRVARYDDFQERYRNIIENVRGGYMISHYVDAVTSIKCRCSNGHVFSISPVRLRTGKWCPACNLSNGKMAVEEYLKSREMQYVNQYIVNLQKEQEGVLEFDFALLDGDRLICLIQYDGEEYFCLSADSKEVESSVHEGEQIKSSYCEDEGIPLIRISCFDIDLKRLDILQRDMSYILDMQLSKYIRD